MRLLENANHYSLVWYYATLSRTDEPSHWMSKYLGCITMKIIGGKWNTFQTRPTLGRMNLKTKLFVNDAVTIMMILPCLSFTRGR